MPPASRYRALMALLLLSGTAALLLVSGMAAPSAVRADDWVIERESAPRRPSNARPKPRKAVQGTDSPAARAETPAETRQLQRALEHPFDDGAFERVVASYRSRDGNLDGLLQELARAGEAQDGAGRGARRVLEGRVYEALGNLAAARAAFEAALGEAQRPSLRLYVLAALLERRQGALEQARALLVRGRETSSGAPAADRRELLEALSEIELDRRDFAAAEAAFAELARGEPDSVFAITAFARALSARSEHARAAEAYRAAVPKLAGDVRALAPVLLEQASSELEAGEPERALETLARAEKMTSGAPGLRHAVFELRLAAHRRAGSLRALGDELSARAPRSFEEAELLARVLEELGAVDGSEAALRKALAFKPRDAQARLRLVRLLTAQGKLDEAIREHERLVESAPGEPTYVTGLAQTLLESGRRDRALALLSRTAQRYPSDARVARALLDVYARWGESARAREMVERLARIEPGDPTHVITLGRELLQRGDEAGSRAAFARAIERAVDRAAAHAALGEIYLDYDLPARALEHYAQAVRLAPEDAGYARGHAEALERVRRFADAEASWRKVMELAGVDRAARREARRRIVQLWADSGQLREKLRELELSFGVPPSGGGAVPPKPAAPPDLEAGRFLAEGYRMLATAGRRARADATLARAAEQVLVRLLELAPGDLDALVSLERMRSARGDLRGASAVLEKLIAADPANAPSYLAQLAQYAQLDYRDAEALVYAERLAALAPQDPAAHTRLAALYQARQDSARAAQSLARALELDPSAHDTALELAELWLAAGEGKRAEGLLRRVLSGSPDDELVRRAARSLIQLHLGAGTLATLEGDFLSLAMRADRRVHRDLLIELYASLCRPLLAARASGASPAASEARAALRAIGQRALKPLLEALASGDVATRNLAIEVLGASESKAAVLPLLALAEGEGDVALRRRALIAAGPMVGDAVIERLSALARGAELRLRDAAAWAIARHALTGKSAKAERAALALSQSETPSVRGYALIGLARAPSTEAAQRAFAALEHDRSAWAKGAAALALGHVGARAAAQALIAALQVESDEVSAAAALALGLLSANEAKRALAARVVEGDAWSGRASAWALSRMASPAPSALVFELPAPVDRSTLTPVLSAHLGGAELAPGALRRAGFHELTAAVRTALAGPLPGARAALRLLGRGPSPLTGWDDKLTRDLAASAAQEITALALHRDSEARGLALECLVGLGSEVALAVLTRALADSEASVRADALRALERAGAPALADATGPSVEAFARALVELAHVDPQWTIRQRAVRLLGGLWASTPSRNVVGPALIHSLERDASAYVREAAAAALARRSPAELQPPVRAALERAAASDPEARTRQAAARALGAR